MRTIKFRAWDKKNNYMITEIDDIDLKEEAIYFESTFSLDFEEIELMQYTGLKDKNGKEIYEGDILNAYLGIYILRNYRNFMPEWIIGKVEIYPQETMFRVGKNLDFKAWNIGKISHLENSTILKAEIIGNIYENPELIGG